MSKHIGFYYKCDKCGDERRGIYHYDDSWYPDGWKRIKYLDFCNKCSGYAEILLSKQKTPI